MESANLLRESGAENSERIAPRPRCGLVGPRAQRQVRDSRLGTNLGAPKQFIVGANSLQVMYRRGEAR